MPRFRSIVLLLLAGALPAAWFAWPHRAHPQSAIAPAGRPVAPAVLGVASCASMACHHANGPTGSKGSEYSTWVAVDPHARAYRVLFDPRSVQMQAQLDRTTQAHQNPLCLKCHAMDADSPLPEALHGDGVGCESCHGPAEKWKSTHNLPGFDRCTPGFRDTKNLTRRAEACVRCHVGTPDQEVNHDLIAAGHPRLRFEYAAYLANYPRHWHVTEARKKSTENEARAWVIGQLVSARAALDLLQSRAAGSTRAHNPAPWPEFAEYECASCHHALKGRVKSPTQPIPSGRAKSKAGALPWGTWYFSLLPTVAAHTPGSSPQRIQAPLASLEEIMAHRFPPPGKVAVQARRQSALLSEWIAQVENAPPLPPPALDRLLAQLAGQRELTTRWDNAAQLYLGLAAVHGGWCEQRGAFDQRAELTRAIRDMGGVLKNAFPPGADRAYDTPGNFRPVTLERSLEAIRARTK